MGTTAQKLQKLADTKAGLGTALTAMGRTVPTKFSEYAAEFTAEVEDLGDTIVGMVDTSSTTPFTIPPRVAAQIEAIRAYCFNGTGLAEAVFPNCTSILGASAFLGCAGLVRCELPECTGTSKASTWASCTALTTLKIPKMDRLSSQSLLGTLSLETVDFSAMTQLTTPWGTTFSTTAQSRGLTSLTLPSITTISAYCFGRNAAGSQCFTPYLMDLYIPNKTIAEVKAMSNFADWGLKPACTIHCSDGNFTFVS